jgi:predicted small secreted protein
MAKDKAPKSSKHEEVLKEALERFDYCEDKLGNARSLMLQDIKFSVGDSDNGYQWPDAIWKERTTERRPALTMNKMPQFINQVVNDARQNRPAIKIRPVDSGADVKSAEIFQDLIRNIESVSNADMAYDTAVECAARGGEGYFRIITDYCDDTSFNQEILFKRVRNPLSVWLDPDYQEPDGSDAMFGFVIDEMSRKEFTKKYPDADCGSWDSPGVSTWVGKDTVRIAEYYRVVREEAELILLSDGSSVYDGDDIQEGLTEVKRRDGYRRKVEWFKLVPDNVLDETEIPCSYIPIIPVVGNEVDIEGKPYRSGLVRNAKDPQRQYNYWASSETEMIALAPKAPFIGYTGQFKDKKWKDANNKNYAYLEAEPIEINGTVAPKPERQPFAGVPTGIVNAKAGANNDIRETMGIYNASLGAPSNENSGKAILAKQREADTGTFHYIDNLSRSIRHAGRIVVEMIPKIYDTKRVVRILGEDGESDHIQIDPSMPKPMMEVRGDDEIKKIFNPNVGKYDVAVTVGPSFASKRAEAAESMMEMTRVAPDFMKVAGDVIVRNMDWPGAQEIADRIKKAMPPELVGDDGDQQIPPKVQAMIQQVQAAEQAIAEQGQLLQAKAQELATKDQELQSTQVEVKAALTELRAQDKVMKAEMKAAQAEMRMQASEMDNGQEQEAAQMLMRYTEGLEQQVQTLSGQLQEMMMIMQGEPEIEQQQTTQQI